MFLIMTEELHIELCNCSLFNSVSLTVVLPSTLVPKSPKPGQFPSLKPRPLPGSPQSLLTTLVQEAGNPRTGNPLIELAPVVAGGEGL